MKTTFNLEVLKQKLLWLVQPSLAKPLEACQLPLSGLIKKSIRQYFEPLTFVWRLTYGLVERAITVVRP